MMVSKGMIMTWLGAGLLLSGILVPRGAEAQDTFGNQPMQPPPQRLRQRPS